MYNVVITIVKTRSYGNIYLPKLTGTFCGVKAGLGEVNIRLS